MEGITSPEMALRAQQIKKRLDDLEIARTNLQLNTEYTKKTHTTDIEPLGPFKIVNFLHQATTWV